jgi:hypothetical protein
MGMRVDFEGDKRIAAWIIGCQGRFVVLRMD